MALTSLVQKYGDYDKPSGSHSDEYFPSLHFDKKLLDALEIESARVGAEFTMVATIRVSNLSESESGRSMSFEIREASVSAKDKKADASSVLFPNDKAG